jgi:leader peptidase (prepilin peptidase)/N-methyltransferase
MSEPVLITGAALVVGLCVGSFLNVVVHRLPKMLERAWREDCLEHEGKDVPDVPAYNLVVPRSACPSCGHRISALENIPVVSWLALRGRCRACSARISPRYPIVEVAGGLLAVAAIAAFGPTPKGLAACVMLWTLLALALIDADTQYLPDDLTLPLLWAGLIANLFGLFAPLASAVIGAVAGYLSLWVVYWAFKLIRGKEGMGYGDFKLLAAIGAWLGWKMLPLVILLSSVAGAIIGIALIAFRGRDHTVPLPFGPYLAIAGAIALFAGPSLVRLWMP